MYDNSEMPTVQPDNTEDMHDFSYMPFERKLRVIELPNNGTPRKIVFSYYNPVYEKHEVSSIVFGEKAQNGCLVPRDSLSYRDLQFLENDSFIPSGAIVSCHIYTRDVSVSQLADVLEKMLEIGEDFYDISPTVSYIEKQYDNRLM